ncbi:MAG: hypothetical protein DRI94_14650 [Bacteroidetes bacterium]|nr:MAG: hypothetical protein DRI94_14650 [Bacteroidota bacterium]
MAEIYTGIKFNYKSLGKTIIKSELLSELKNWCAFFNEKNLAPPYLGGSSGNLSFRIKPGTINFIITASHTALRENMPDSDFTKIVSYDENKNLITGKGTKEPSSESIMHHIIYKYKPEINAVFHGHSPEILKFADQLKIPVTKKEFEYGTIKLAKEALKLLTTHNFIILKNHGFISLGKTVQEAGNLTINFLNNCKSINNE